MNKQQIALKKLSAVYVDNLSENITNLSDSNDQMNFIHEAMRLGFMPTQRAAEQLSSKIYKLVLTELAKLVGADKVWKPFHKGFPDYVFNASLNELYITAILHYWTEGTWVPDEQITQGEDFNFDNHKFKSIDVVDKKAFMKIFTSLLSSNGSLTPYDKDVLMWFMDTYSENDLASYIPTEIPFKETLCLFIKKGFELSYLNLPTNLLKTTTDVLRVAVGLSGGDITLVQNSNFKLSNKQRRYIMTALENVIKEEDVARYEKKWQKLFHHLHITSQNKYNITKKIATLCYYNNTKSHASKVEEALNKQNYTELISLLKYNAGVFARRLDEVLRAFNNKALETAMEFMEVADKVDTRVLMQVKNHFIYRNDKTRIAIPKGNVAKAIIIAGYSNKINKDICELIVQGIDNVLRKRFGSLPSLGKVYIDPILSLCPIQMSMRNASDGLKVLQRGTRIPLDKTKNVLRFFIHWIGSDIDLSAGFLDENLNFTEQIAYYNLRSTDGLKAAHSGDYTYAPAPDGACEFIDIDLDSIQNKKRHRYIAMDVRVFSGEGFRAQQANAGWMMRDTVSASKHDHFDPKTVEQRIALDNNSKQALVAIFDVVERVVIWLDLVGQSDNRYPNNIHNNKASVIDMLTAAIELKQPTVSELLELHSETRGELVDSPEKADVIYGEEMIYKYETILSEYLK